MPDPFLSYVAPFLLMTIALVVWLVAIYCTIRLTIAFGRRAWRPSPSLPLAGRSVSAWFQILSPDCQARIRALVICTGIFVVLVALGVLVEPFVLEATSVD